MCLSLVTAVMAVTALNVALPTMQRSLGASASELQWIVDANVVVFAGLLLPAGAIGDRFGRRRSLLAGLVMFGVGTAVAGLASGASQVIAGRAVMGIGAALIMPATLSTIIAIFPADERARATAIWAGLAGGGGAIGPIVSGALLEHYWWGATLLATIPVAIATFAAVWAFAPESRDETRTPLDVPGAASSLVGLGALVFALIQGPADGWTDDAVLGALVVAGAALGTFARRQGRTDHPMLPLELFRDWRFSTGCGVITVTFLVMVGLFFLATHYLQFARGYSALVTGIAMLPVVLTFLLIAPRSPSISARVGAFPAIALGLITMAGGFAMLSTVSAQTPYISLAVGLSMIGTGMSLTAPPATTAIVTALPVEKAGIGSAVNDTTREVGTALGIAVFGSVVNAAYRSRLDLAGLGLPVELRAAAEGSIGGANTVRIERPWVTPSRSAPQPPSPMRSALRTASRSPSC
jgi:EmrB/QacA subfamily drug resistance transporter